MPSQRRSERNRIKRHRLCRGEVRRMFWGLIIKLLRCGGKRLLKTYQDR